ncbi:MAG: DNA repair protein RadC [Bacteroidota bacterium]
MIDQSTTPIREWMVEDRPREKMMHKGIEALTEAELLATILSTGTRELSAIDLGRLLLREFGSLQRLARASVQELMKIRGIGKAKAIAIAASFELSRRKMEQENRKQRMRSPAQFADYLRPRLMDLDHERFYAVYLNPHNEVVGEKLISVGGVSSTVADPRVIFREGILLRASAVVLVHNHPSGSLRPSQMDDQLTDRLSKAGKLMDIDVMDHIIVTHDGYFSYVDAGRIYGSEAYMGSQTGPYRSQRTGKFAKNQAGKSSRKSRTQRKGRSNSRKSKS